MQTGTVQKSDICNIFADVFTYPSSDYNQKVELMASYVGNNESNNPAKIFESQVSGLIVSDIEELFTKTFDMNPDSCLDLGWHLFGEGYDRGEFLAKMREQLRANGIPEHIELPDHLSHILQLLGTQENEKANELVSKTVLPALVKIKTAVPEDNMFSKPLAALEQFLTENYHIIEDES